MSVQTRFAPNDNAKLAGKLKVDAAKDGKGGLKRGKLLAHCLKRQGSYLVQEFAGLVSASSNACTSATLMSCAYVDCFLVLKGSVCATLLFSIVEKPLRCLSHC
jgi:hypothetical protein